MVTKTQNERRALRVRALIVNEGKLLVVRHRADNPHYVLPGGHLDFGEQPEAGLIRELEEEFGVTPIIGSLRYVHTFTQEREDEMVQSFECFFAIDNGADFVHFSPDAPYAHELYEVRWLSPDDEVIMLPGAVHDDFKRGTWPSSTRLING